jgi:hypothetical protein
MPARACGRPYAAWGDPDPDAALVVRERPTPRQVSVADWTLREIIRRPHDVRQLLLGIAFGQGMRTVGTKVGVSKSQVSSRYFAERRRLAAEWQACDDRYARIDEPTFNRWLDLFEKRLRRGAGPS